MAIELIRQGQLLAKRYRLLNKIKQDGMGAVWLAVEVKTDRRVAVKFPQPDDQLSLEQTKAVNQEEARVLKSLIALACVVKCLDQGQEDDLAFFVMPFIDGFNLRELLEPKLPLDHHTAAVVGGKTAAILSQIHGLGVVWGDLRQKNMLVEDKTNRLIALDFGITAVNNLGLPKKLGLVWGHPHYLAPEVWQGVKISPASDVYALGIFLYHLVCGQFPFDGNKVDIVAWHHLKLVVPPHPELSGPLYSMILSCLQKNPGYRPTAVEAQLELAKIARA